MKFTPSSLFSSSLILLAAPLAATSFVMVPDEDLADQAAAVVEARVLSVEAAPGEGMPATDYQIEVERVLKGSPPGSSAHRARPRRRPRRRPRPEDLGRAGVRRGRAGAAVPRSRSRRRLSRPRPDARRLPRDELGRSGGVRPRPRRGERGADARRAGGRPRPLPSGPRPRAFRRLARRPRRRAAAGARTTSSPRRPAAPPPSAIGSASSPPVGTSFAGSLSTAAAASPFGSTRTVSHRSPSPRRSTPFAPAQQAWDDDPATNIDYRYGGTTTATGGLTRYSTASTPSPSATPRGRSAPARSTARREACSPSAGRGTTRASPGSATAKPSTPSAAATSSPTQHRVLFQPEPQPDEGGRRAVRPRAGAYPRPRALLRRSVPPLRPAGPDGRLHPRRRPGRPLHRRRPRRDRGSLYGAGSGVGRPAAGGAQRADRQLGVADFDRAGVERQLDRRDGFVIELKSPLDDFQEVAVTGPDVTAFTLTSLPAGLPGTFRVRARNAAGDSDPPTRRARRRWTARRRPARRRPTRSACRRAVGSRCGCGGATSTRLGDHGIGKAEPFPGFEQDGSVLVLQSRQHRADRQGARRQPPSTNGSGCSTGRCRTSSTG